MDDFEYDAAAFGAHPDDVEIGCGGTIARLVGAGKKVAVIDLTRGESATRGSPEIRARETAAATEVLGIATRINLGLADARLTPQDESVRAVVAVLRRLRPRIVFNHAAFDRHPDHGGASQIVDRAAYVAGLKSIYPDLKGARFRPDRIVYYPLFYDHEPSFAVDITDTFDTKIKAIECYRSQFFQDADEEKTLIASPLFWEKLKSRAGYFGTRIRRRYAEPFVMHELACVETLDQLRNDL